MTGGGCRTRGRTASGRPDRDRGPLGDCAPSQHTGPARGAVSPGQVDRTSSADANSLPHAYYSLDAARHPLVSTVASVLMALFTEIAGAFCLLNRERAGG